MPLYFGFTTLRQSEISHFPVLAQNDDARPYTIAVVAAHVGVAGDRSTVTGEQWASLLHSNKHWRGRLGIRDSFGCFSRITNCSAELRRELATWHAFSRYEQFETSPGTIELELRPRVCVKRQT